MVGTVTIVVSAYGESPPEQGASRKIDGGPLYPRDDVIKALGTTLFRPWTRECVKDLAKLELDDAEVTELVNSAVCHGRYKDSEWCQQFEHGPWAACDAYVLVRREYNKYAHKELSVEYFIKLAIAKSGIVVLLISCHT